MYVWECQWPNIFSEDKPLDGSDDERAFCYQVFMLRTEQIGEGKSVLVSLTLWFEKVV